MKRSTFCSKEYREGALSSDSNEALFIDKDLASGAMCRTGPRLWHDPNDTDPAPLLEIPPPSKASARPVKNVSLASGGVGAAGLIPVTFQVTGKDARDEDLDDDKLFINTGTEIAVGLESFIPGGASNMYSAQ